MWSFRRKIKLSAEDIAALLLSEIVVRDEDCPELEMELTEEQRNDYLARCKLHRLAMVLMVIVAEGKSNPKALLLREAVERRVFGELNADSVALLEQVQAAMANLRVLLFPEGPPKELSWSRSWLSEIGIDAIDPADLTVFAIHWQLQYSGITKILRGFRIKQESGRTSGPEERVVCEPPDSQSTQKEEKKYDIFNVYFFATAAAVVCAILAFWSVLFIVE